MILLYEPLITDVSKRYGNNRWLAYSNKLKRVVYLFSDLEYEHWLQVETDPAIITFCEQPIKMEIIQDGRTHSSIIDMWVKYIDGEETFIEIKYSNDLLKKTVEKQIYVQEVWCKANQKKHAIKTEREIRLNPIKLSNLKLLIKQVNNSISPNPQTIDFIKNHITEEPKTIHQIANETKIEFQTSFNILCILLYEGSIKCNFEVKHLGKYSEVWK
ncbi:TnsA endonuclease N-terminal domain-containing protein [Lysinibacillus sphaericus]|uniref:TnsA endonuclease N-terminal domain-containing protein n=1 Tax=Lysinibacillus sphaericus TaxID=1421 RepID=UPI001E53A08E|nr:TnsA endonuclease N-terminal domain-containing protein [Lysinibacillus sphaericus]